MSMKPDLSKNTANLKWVPRYGRFDFPRIEDKVKFKQELKNVFKDPSTKILCDEKTFSAKDNASQKFLNTKFFDLMLRSLGMRDEYDIVRCMNGFKTMSIDYDAFYRQRSLIEKMNENPGRFVDTNTPVCYIFNQKLSDLENNYTFELYVKTRISQDKEGNYVVQVMSLHWGDRNDKDHPYKVLNKKTKEYDNIGHVMDYLRETYDKRDQDRDRFDD